MDKKLLRAELKEIRANINIPGADEEIRNSFFRVIKPEAGTVIATYIPTQSELNVDKLNRALGYAGYKLCLPCITQNGLVFREWGIYTDLVNNKFGMPEPTDESEILNPNIIIVPILGFNKQKYRIGYGGGYYDKTFAQLNVLKVGVAYSAQEVAEIFEERHDISLDLIITEDKVYS